MDEKGSLEDVRNLIKLYDLDNEQLKEIISEHLKNNYVPIEIFSINKLNPLEAIVKYLKENKNLKFSEISKLLDRDARTIWTTYNNTKIKSKISGKSVFLIPLKIFKNKNLSILESLVKYLRNDSRLSLSEIAKILSRDQRNIWKVYNNSIRKSNEEKR